MERPRLGYQAWAIAVFPTTTNLKGVSSMKLHRDLASRRNPLGVSCTQIARYLECRQGLVFRHCRSGRDLRSGLEKNKHESKKLHVGRGGTGKSIVVGVKERESKQVKAQVIENTKRNTMHDFIEENVEAISIVNTDDFKSYRNLAYYNHEFVKHSVGEYINEMAQMNGIESFWSMLKRAHKGTYHGISKKHLKRYINEVVVRNNIREQNRIKRKEIISPA